MVSTDLGIFIFVRPEQFLNEPDAIDVTEFGMVNDPVRPLQPQKA
jgi:hypothetical protein